MANACLRTEKIPSFIKVKWDSGAEDIHYALQYEGTPEDLRLRYEEELNETPENRENGLSRLKEVIRRENVSSLSDTMLLAVLRSSKFDLKKSESKLRSFIVYRRQVIKKLAMIDIDVVKNVIDSTPSGFLPYRDKHGRAIFYTRPYGIHFDKFNMEEFMVTTLALMLFGLTFDLSTTARGVFFGDTKIPSESYLFHFLNIYRKYVFTALSFPWRVPTVEVFNEITIIRWAFKISRHLLPEKIYKRINFNGTYENLTKSYHPDLLPEEFGGNLGKISNDFLKQKFLEFIANLKEEAK